MGSLNARICGSLPCTNLWVPLNAQICGFLWFYGSIELATLWVPLSAPTCCYVGVARWDLLGGSCPLVPDAAVPCTVGVARLPPCFRVGLPVGLTLRHIRIGAPMRRLPGQQGPFVRLHRPVARLPLSCILKGTGRSLEVDMFTGHGRSTPVGTGGSVSRGRPASVGGHRSVSTGEGARAPASCSQLELAPWACAGVHVSSQFQCMQTSGGPPSRRSCLHLSSLFRAGRAVHLPKLPVLMSERPTEPMQDRSGADLRSNNADALPY